MGKQKKILLLFSIIVGLIALGIIINKQKLIEFGIAMIPPSLVYGVGNDWSNY